MSEGHEQEGGAATQDRPSDEGPSEIDQRAAYEAELNRITSSEMILQTAVSLINIGGRRLGLGAPPNSPAGAPGQAASPPPERDLEQVRDAIDGASALLPILERRMPRELGPLRDAIAQLQVAYAREASATAGQSTSAGAPQSAGAVAKDPSGSSSGGQAPPAGGGAQRPPDGAPRPGPAESSGRLWVPGR